MNTVPLWTIFFSFFLKVFFLVVFPAAALVAIDLSRPLQTTGLVPRVRRHVGRPTAPYVFAVAFFLLAIVPLRGPFRVRALVWVRCPRPAGFAGGGDPGRNRFQSA